VRSVERKTALGSVVDDQTIRVVDWISIKAERIFVEPAQKGNEFPVIVFEHDPIRLLGEESRTPVFWFVRGLGVEISGLVRILVFDWRRIHAPVVDHLFEREQGVGFDDEMGLGKRPPLPLWIR